MRLNAIAYFPEGHINFEFEGTILEIEKLEKGNMKKLKDSIKLLMNT